MTIYCLVAVVECWNYMWYILEYELRQGDLWYENDWFSLVLFQFKQRTGNLKPIGNQIQLNYIVRLATPQKKTKLFNPANAIARTHFTRCHPGIQKVNTLARLMVHGPFGRTLNYEYIICIRCICVECVTNEFFHITSPFTKSILAR